MGFFNEAFKHPGWYAGGAGLGLAMNNFGQPESNPLAPVRSRPAVKASDIGLDSNLAKALGAVGTTQGAAIAGSYGRASNQAKTDARKAGSYYGDRLATGQNLAQGNLKSGLEDILGATGYADWKGKREYDDNMNLARYVGDLNKPSTLEEILSGLGVGAQVGGQVAGMSGGAGRRKTTSSYDWTPASSEALKNYQRYQSGGSGLNLY